MFWLILATFGPPGWAVALPARPASAALARPWARARPHTRPPGLPGECQANQVGAARLQAGVSRSTAKRGCRRNCSSEGPQLFGRVHQLILAAPVPQDVVRLAILERLSRAESWPSTAPPSNNSPCTAPPDLAPAQRARGTDWKSVLRLDLVGKSGGSPSHGRVP